MRNGILKLKEGEAKQTLDSLLNLIEFPDHRFHAYSNKLASSSYILAGQIESFCDATSTTALKIGSQIKEGKKLQFAEWKNLIGLFDQAYERGKIDQIEIVINSKRIKIRNSANIGNTFIALEEVYKKFKSSFSENEVKFQKRKKRGDWTENFALLLWEMYVQIFGFTIHSKDVKNKELEFIAEILSLFVDEQGRDVFPLEINYYRELLHHKPKPTKSRK